MIMNSSKSFKLLFVFAYIATSITAVGDDFVQLGDKAKSEKHIDQALEYYNLASLLNPNDITAQTHYAKALFDSEYYAKAEEIYKKALLLDQKSTTILLDLARICEYQNKNIEALSYLMKLVSLTPKNTSVYAKIAGVYSALNKKHEAHEIYKFLLTVDPDNKQIQGNAFLSALSNGDFKNGFELYRKYRWNALPQQIKNRVEHILWDGSTRVYGKKILIHFEQGLGDSFQFVRYAKILHEKGAKVVALVHKPLEKIFSLCPYLHKVVSNELNAGPIDLYVFSFDLPLCMETTVKDIPASIPYLYSDIKLEKFWEKQLKQDKNFKVGVCWEGQVNWTDSYKRMLSKRRFLPFKFINKLCEIPNISFYSLQKNTDNTCKLLKGFGKDFDSTSGAFMDTAAIMKKMDLVITIDTSIVHLAGGLGVPVWVLLPFDTDWRWCPEKETSPWYPTAKLFRQPKSGDWEAVISKVSEELKTKVDNFENEN